MFDISKKLEDRTLRSLEKDIANYLFELGITPGRPASDLLSEDLISMFKSWLVSYDEWNPGDLISAENIEHTTSIIDRYEDICIDGHTKSFLLKSYKFERFGTSIDFTDQDIEKIFGLKKELEEFFFITHVFTEDKSQNALYISRFRDYDEDPLKLYKNFNGFFDGYADKAGMMYDYLPKEVAWFCLKNNPEAVK